MEFASCAHAILHVYYTLSDIRITERERAELATLDDLRDILISSETIINFYFQ